MEEHVDVRDWLETIETLVDACVMIIARVLFPRWSCLDHVRHEMTFCGRVFFSNALSLDILPLICISRHFFFQKEFLSFTFVPSFLMRIDKKRYIY